MNNENYADNIPSPEGKMSPKKKWTYVIFGIFFVLLLAVGILGYLLYVKIDQNNILLAENARLTKNNKQLSESYDVAQEKIRDLTETLDDKAAKVAYLKERFGDVTGELDDVTDAIDKIQKLNDLDPKLLKKYSDVSFLNENYTPKDLEMIPEEYDYPGDGERELFHSEVLPFLTELVEEAKDDGIDLSVISAYRSFGEQRALKNRYTVVYGADTANAFSAEQGYSEHQLGTAVDFTTRDVGASFSGFRNTRAYEWLLENAYKYGFILSYPKENQYYTYEPWHWRFVGIKLATELHEENQYFYQMPQNEIDEYLIDIFDDDEL